MLHVIKDTTKEMFEAESDKIHAQVMQWVKEQVPLSVAEQGTIMPEMYAA